MKGGGAQFTLKLLHSNVMCHTIVQNNAKGRFYDTQLSSQAAKNINSIIGSKFIMPDASNARKIRAKKPKSQYEKVIIIAHFVLCLYYCIAAQQNIDTIT